MFEPYHYWAQLTCRPWVKAEMPKWKEFFPWGVWKFVDRWFWLLRQLVIHSGVDRWKFWSQSIARRELRHSSKSAGIVVQRPWIFIPNLMEIWTVVVLWWIDWHQHLTSASEMQFLERSSRSMVEWINHISLKLRFASCGPHVVRLRWLKHLVKVKERWCLVHAEYWTSQQVCKSAPTFFIASLAVCPGDN